MLAVCLLCSAVTAESQTVVRSFDGDTGPGAAICDAGRTHCGWPDMNVGANGKQVMQVTCSTCLPLTPTFMSGQPQ